MFKSFERYKKEPQNKVPFLFDIRVKNILLILASAFFLICITISNSMNFPVSHKSEYIVPPESLKYFHFGYNEPMADSFWIRTLQDIDFCNKRKKENNNYCEDNSWLGSMYRLIIEFSPKYLPAYRVGGIALSLLIKDVDAASFLYDRGEKEFPQDWVILYRGAFHAAVNEKNPAKAAQRLERVAAMSHLKWLYALAARLYTEAGQKELGLLLFQDIQKNEKLDPDMLKRVKENLGIL